MTDHNSLLALVADERKGFIKIPNLLFDALMCAQITSTQKVICDFILRQTYGWNRKEVPISITEFAIVFGTSRSWITRQLKGLLDKKIVVRTKKNLDRKSVYKINHNIYEWDRDCLNFDQLQLLQSYRPDIIPRFVTNYNASEMMMVNSKVPSIVNSTVTSIVNSKVPSIVNSTVTSEHVSSIQPPSSQPPLNTKVNTNIKTFKNSENLSNLNYEYYSLANLLLEKAIKNNPELQMPDLHEWALIIEKMIVDEQRRPEDIKKAILFAHESDFWSSNIINAHRLDTQFELLNSQRVRKEKDDLKKKKTHYDEYEIFVGV